MPYPLQRLLSLLLLIALAPLMALIATVILAIDGKPILFRQARVGRDRTPFKLYKFRSMVNDADRLLEANTDPRGRLTRTGGALRKSGLDELPQLLNVLRGDMALVGPRAMLPEIASRMPVKYESRFSVLPGMTGLAQISGRNSIPWSRRLALDVEYTIKRNLRFDIGIALRTLRVLLTSDGHSPDRNSAQVDDLGLMGRE